MEDLVVMVISKNINIPDHYQKLLHSKAHTKKSLRCINNLIERVDSPQQSPSFNLFTCSVTETKSIEQNHPELLCD